MLAEIYGNLHVGLACAGGSIGIGIAAVGAELAIGRNPGTFGKVFTVMLIGMALAMRLYGNILGGESVLTIMLTHTPLGLGALPFYFFELFVAVVQALVFALLVIAFVGTMCMHDEEAAAAH